MSGIVNNEFGPKNEKRTESFFSDLSTNGHRPRSSSFPPDMRTTVCVRVKKD